MYYSLVKRFAVNVFAIRCCFFITFAWHTIIASLSFQRAKTNAVDTLNVMHLTLMYANRISKGNGGKEWQKRTNMLMSCCLFSYIRVRAQKQAQSPNKMDLFDENEQEV